LELPLRRREVALVLVVQVRHHVAVRAVDREDDQDQEIRREEQQLHPGHRLSTAKTPTISGVWPRVARTVRDARSLVKRPTRLRCKRGTPGERAGRVAHAPTAAHDVCTGSVRWNLAVAANSG